VAPPAKGARGERESAAGGSPVEKIFVTFL